jgi:hypothetical protein
MYSSLSIIRMIKLRKMRWAGHVACTLLHWSISFRISVSNVIRISQLPHACNMFRLSHPHFFHSPIICSRFKSMNKPKIFRT